MKLYYSPGACSLSPHIALLEAGLPYDLVKVDLRAKKLENGDDFLKVNPKGQVPALQLDSGELVSDRIKLATPEGGKPDDIVETTKEIVEKLAAEDPDAPVGVCFPAIVSHGVTLSAANVSKKWIGLHAEELFEK